MGPIGSEVGVGELATEDVTRPSTAGCRQKASIAAQAAPRPQVDVCLMVAAKCGSPLVEPRRGHLFREFVRRAFEGHGNSVRKTLRPFFTKTPTPQACQRQWILFGFLYFHANCRPVDEGLRPHDPDGASGLLAFCQAGRKEEKLALM